MEPEKNTTGAATASGNANKPAINLNGRIVASPVVSCRIEGADGAILFNADIDGTLLINPTGVVVWNFISRPKTIDEIVAHVSAAFTNNPDPAAIRKDIETFVMELAPDYVKEVTG
jgi:hypothetical protein